MTHKQSMRRGRILLQAGTALWLLTSSAAYAQEATPQDETPTASPDGEILVTARRREERLQDVPVAATVLSTETLDRTGTTISSLSTMVPSLQIAQAGTGNGGSITIRGVSSSSNNNALEQAVAVSVDGVQISRGRILQQGFFDQANVQVLKGPQALFFGKNSPAGVIAVDSKNPGASFEGYARLGYEIEAKEYIAEGAASVPVTDNLGVRVALRFNDQRGGYIRNDAQAILNPLWGKINQAPANRDLPGERGTLVRLTAVYNPTDSFKVTGKILIGNSRADGENPPRQAVCAKGVTVSRTQGGLIDPFDDCKLNGHTSYGVLPADVAAAFAESNNGQYYGSFNSVLSSLTMNYKAGDITLTSVTGYVDYHSITYGDTSGSTFAAYSGYNDEKFSSISQEFRAITDFGGPLNFSFGALYEETDREYANAGMLGSGVAPDTRNGKSNTYRNRLLGTSKTYSAFVQGNWKLTPEIELAGGVRYTIDEREGSIGNIYVNNTFAALSPNTLLPEGQRLAASPTAHNLSPEVTLSWHIAPDVMVYGAFKTGYLSGGVSAPAVVSRAFNNQNIVFEPETAIGGEVGIKFKTMGGAVSGDATLYRYDYNNLQVSAFDSATLSFFLGNAAKARAQGAEVSLNARLSDYFSLRGGVNYNDGTFVSFPGAQCYAAQAAGTGAGQCSAGRQNLSGRPLPRSPEWTGSAGFTATAPISATWKITSTADMRYTSGYYYVEQLNPTGYQKPFATLNASLSISDDKWDLSILGRNLTNKYYGAFAIDKPGANDGSVLAVIGRPREVVLQVTRKF